LSNAFDPLSKIIIIIETGVTHRWLNLFGQVNKLILISVTSVKSKRRIAKLYA